MTALAASVTVTSAADAIEVIRESAAAGIRLRLAGRGTWLDAGRPVRADRELSLAGLTGIVEYTPGDFTLTALAGTPLDEIAMVTRVERQWLALDPFGSASGTIGATVATGSAGPLAHAFGPPRDNVLGVEVATGNGTLVRGGGRVVKNVAGFDLTRLFCGSWGTLGAITEITLRVRGVPEVDATVALPVNEGRAPLDAMIETLRSAPIAPLALEMVGGTLAEALGLGGEARLLARLAGNADAVRGQQTALARIMPFSEADAGIWDALREREAGTATVVRLSNLPSRFGETWTCASAAAAIVPGSFVHGSPGRGLVRCIVPRCTDDELLPALGRFASCDATRIFERLPARFWSGTAPSPAGDRLSRGVKHAYDPMNILNPGILGEAEHD